jgi:[acyl-carrier-protein] S-malonyltransferase
MSESRVILCPGQGAQQIGMGRAWFEQSPEAAQTFAAADEILGDRLGARLSDLCFNGPAETLNRTDVSQPALFTVGVACHQALVSSGWEGAPAALAGLSLGEYTALHLAGAFTFEDGLELVALRGRAMQDAAEASEGSMVALIGADESQAREVCEKARESGILTPANLNAPGQIVLSGDASACDRAEHVASEMGFRATRLQVAGAFHSDLMAPAADRLRAALDGVEVKSPSCPVMSNVTAVPHGPDESAGLGLEGAIRRRLVEQLTSPVRWSECCQWLAGNVSGNYHELAPGKVLSGLMRRISRETKVTSHDQPS